MTSQRVIINEATCYHAPAKRVLDISVVGGQTFLSISENVTETHTDSTFRIIEEIMVDTETLVNAIVLLTRHDQRMDRNKSSLEEMHCCQKEES